MKVRYIIVISAMLCTSTFAYAQGSENGEFYKSKEWKANKDEMIKKMYQQLGLTDEQNKKLQNHRNRHRKNRDSFRSKIQKKQNDLNQELQKSFQNQKLIKQLHNEIKTLKMQRSDHRLNSIQEVRQILTPDQFKKFMELKNSMGRPSRR